MERITELHVGLRAKGMANKLNIVLEEADESQSWLELAAKCGVTSPESIRDLHFRANRIVGLCVASIQTLRSETQPRNRGSEESKIEAKA